MDSPDHVVGVVASAGGVQALCALLSTFGHDANAFIVAMRLSPDRESVLPEVLARPTAMDEHRAQEREPLARNRIYVVPASYDVILRDR